MNELVKTNQEEIYIPAVNINQELPPLSEATELPLDLCGNYWTPETEGESKRLFFVKIEPQKVLSADGSGMPIDLDCAFFLEQKEDGTVQTITNGSRRLVGILEQFVQSGFIKSGTPLKITYKGKKKNKTNNFTSDNWSVIPLLIKV